MNVDKPSAYKAEPIALKSELSAAEAFRVVARACIKHFRLNQRLLIASRSPEPLHQTRVAIRRLRSALTLFKPIVKDQEYERLNHGLRDVLHRLGKARNLDVYIAQTAGVRDKSNLSSLSSNALGEIKARRSRAYDRIIRRLQSKRFHRLMQDFDAWMKDGPWCTRDELGKQGVRDQLIERFAVQVIEHGRRKVNERGRHLDCLSPKKRHRLRIEAKKLRYASEFFASLADGRKRQKRYKLFVVALEDLQTRLGELNDIETGREIAKKLAHRDTVPAKGSRALCNKQHQASRTAGLLSSACKAYRRFSRIKPFW